VRAGSENMLSKLSEAGVLHFFSCRLVSIF